MTAAPALASSVLSDAARIRGAFGMTPDLKALDIFVHGTKLLGQSSGNLRIAITGSCTTDMIARAAAFGAAQEGFEPTVLQAGFGAWQQEALDAQSSARRFAPGIVLIVTTWRDAVTALPLGTPEVEVTAAIAARVAVFRRIWESWQAGEPGRKIIQHLPALPGPSLAGPAEWRQPASPRAQILAFRAALMAAGPDIVFLDCDGLPEDAAAWFGAKLPFAQPALPAYAARFRAALRHATGRMKKALVLDLDNTLWGGVIGDDGIDGLELGPDTPRGEAFAAFQGYAKALAARGVILTVCSKNDPAIARTGFSHPHSQLAPADFAAFECGWGDKAEAVRRIAASLNIGTDAIVFADDNPAECALVREALTDVAVVELGSEPAEFITRLERGHWFDSQALSREDFTRQTAYQARDQAETARLAAGETDLPGFLRGLRMQARVFRADAPNIPRIAQLEAKTNQFNLTTPRYTEAAIRGFAARPDMVVLAATLRDKFGDHGLVSSLIARVAGDVMHIESWVMSCRVFSRTLEAFMLRHLLAEARAHNATHLRGMVIATAKNQPVADLFTRLGFTPCAEAATWERACNAPFDDLISYIDAPADLAEIPAS